MRAAPGAVGEGVAQNGSPRYRERRIDCPLGRPIRSLMGDSPWALWLIPVCALIAVFIPLFSRAGQALAKEQMGLLSSVIERALPAQHLDAHQG
jgi:hypothetical protein